MVCDTCKNKGICKFKETAEQYESQINLIGVERKEPFSIKLECKHRENMQNFEVKPYFRDITQNDRPKVKY